MHACEIVPARVLSMHGRVPFHDAYIGCHSLSYLHNAYHLSLETTVLSLCVEEVNENESSCDENVVMAYDAFGENLCGSLETLVTLEALRNYLV